MKAGFKPTLWTKKEWQDNRAPVCKGCGVGEALDQLQPFRNKPLAGMSAESVSQANAVFGKLRTALQKAESKCGPSQKETKQGIGEYKKGITEFEKKLKAVAEVYTKRANLLKAFPKTMDEFYAKLGSDADYKSAVVAFSKAEQTGELFDAYLLFKQKKFTDMVRKYGPKNDYNIPGAMNTLLMEVFVSKKNLTPDRIKVASKVLNGSSMPGGGDTIPGSFNQMLGGGGMMGRFHKSDDFKTYAAKKLPIPDGKI